MSSNFGITTNQNEIHDEIKDWLNLENAYYHSVQNLKSPCVLPKIKIHNTIILLVTLYGCEYWSLTPSEQQRLRVFDTKARRIFWSNTDEVTKDWEGGGGGRVIERIGPTYVVLCTFYFKVINSRRKRRVRHAVYMGDMRNA
jgi:hypothetical protein